ncbi:MAG: regulatory signaling modulator protein AmpE [Halothiobacillus sp.]
MKLMALIVVMLLERFWPALSRWRADRAAERLIHRARTRLADVVGHPVATGILWLGLPIVLYGVLTLVDHGVMGVLAYIGISIVVLLLMLAPRQAHRHVDDLQRACEHDDEAAVHSALAQLAEGTALESEPIVEAWSTQTLAERIITLGFHEWFTVLFWFVLAGPVGALFYRLTDWFAQPPHDSTEPNSSGCMRLAQLQAWLDWPAARIYAVLLLLAGGFNRGLEAWLQGGDATQGTVAQHNSALIGRVGHAALELEREDDCDSATSCLADQSRWIKGATAIVRRSLLLGLGLVALFTLSSWIR